MPRSPTPDAALATAVRQLRLDRGMTLEAVAFRAGVTTGSIGRLELGQSVPTWDTVRQIARALDIKLVDLAAAVEAASDST